MSRAFARVPRADAAPGRCVRCIRDTDLLDLGAEPIRGYGVAYLCTVCFSELADNMQLVQKIELEELRDRELQVKIKLVDERNAADARLTEVEAAITNFEEGLARGIHDLVDRFGRDLVRTRVDGSRGDGSVGDQIAGIPVVTDERIPERTIFVVPVDNADDDGTDGGSPEAGSRSDVGVIENVADGSDVWSVLHDELADATDFASRDDAVS